MEKMKEFSNTSCSGYNLALHAKMHSNIYETVIPKDLTKLNIPKVLTDEYKNCIDKEIELNRQSQASVITSKLNKIDPLRDADISYILQITKAGLLSPIASHREAAAKLEVITRPYIDIKKKTFEQKTLLINGMIHDLDSDEMKKYLKVLSLDEAMNDLKKYNDQFNELLIQRTKEKSVNKTENSHIIRPRTDAVFKRIRELIYASQILTSNEADMKMIGELIDHINEFLAKAKTEYNQTRPRPKKSTDEKKTDDTTNKDDSTKPSDNPDSKENPDSSENPEELKTAALTTDINTKTEDTTKSDTTAKETSTKKKRKAPYRLYERPADIIDSSSGGGSDEKPGGL